MTIRTKIVGGDDACASKKDISLRRDDGPGAPAPRHLSDLPLNDINGLSHQAATLATRSIEINSFNSRLAAITFRIHPSVETVI